MALNAEIQRHILDATEKGDTESVAHFLALGEHINTLLAEKKIYELPEKDPAPSLSVSMLIEQRRGELSAERFNFLRMQLIERKFCRITALALLRSCSQTNVPASFEELNQLPDEEVLKLRNIGKVSLREIRTGVCHHKRSLLLYGQ